MVHDYELTKILLSLTTVALPQFHAYSTSPANAVDDELEEPHRHRH